MTVTELISKLLELNGRLEVKMYVNAEYITEIENVYQSFNVVMLED